MEARVGLDQVWRYRVSHPGNGPVGVLSSPPEDEYEDVSSMALTYRMERARGTKESPQQLALLRAKWPIAFPLEQQDVRPLAIGAAREIAAVMDWSLPYTLGVLKSWKMAPVYCQAILSYDQRITLDGAPAEPVETKAKDLAAKRLAEVTAREAAKRETKAAASGLVKPTLAPTPPPETPEQLRARVRASLLRRSA
jgi:sRNA-binding protein